MCLIIYTVWMIKKWKGPLNASQRCMEVYAHKQRRMNSAWLYLARKEDSGFICFISPPSLPRRALELGRCGQNRGRGRYRRWGPMVGRAGGGKDKSGEEIFQKNKIWARYRKSRSGKMILRNITKDWISSWICKEVQHKKENKTNLRI